jgi:hypothetical protein
VGNARTAKNCGRRRFHHIQAQHFDVEGERGKTTKPEQLVAFTCNWRVAILTDCPDDIVRSEFDPAAFVAGVRNLVQC